MPNIASALKSEIARIARKQIREETQPLKKAVAPYRSEIAELRRRAQALEQQIKRLGRAAAKAPSPAKETEGTALRFSAKGMASNRKRLELSAADFGKLVGASSLSVYKWEQGKARPREKNIQAIASIRNLGKKEAVVRLETSAKTGGQGE